MISRDDRGRDGSTLFLDEISEMPPNLQTRFLRVLQEREFRPLGSTKTIESGLPVVAATNRPIAQALAENRLREDLYYRLNTFQIEIPPLRERKEDIPPLVAVFVKRFAQELGKTGTGDCAGSVSKIARLQLARKCPRTAKHHRVCGRSGPPGTNWDEGITRGSAVTSGAAECRPQPRSQTTSARKAFDDLERSAIIQALAQCHGNKKKAASCSGFSAQHFTTR